MGSKGDTLKMACMYSFLRRHEVDIFGVSETNVDWRVVGFQDSMWGRIQTWFENRKMAVSHNLRDGKTESSYQAGGTSTLIFDKIALCKSKIEVDDTRLGRWSSILLYGKGAVKTRFVTAYCPCRNKKRGRSVYQQHLRYFEKKKMHDICPINQFWVDLQAAIKTWNDNGEQIILMGDWNRSISKVNKKLSDLGLREVITSKHGLNHAPRTHKRGSVPIDGIYANSTIQAHGCGYLPFNKGFSSDHRILWIDVPIDAILGFSMHDSTVPRARRLKMNDPRVKKKYNTYLHDFSVKHHLYSLILSVFKRAVYPLPQDVIDDLLKFERLRTEGMIAAEKRCRKLRRGVYEWSPEFSKARDLIKMWTMVRERKLSFAVDLKSILRVSTRINECVDFSMTLHEVQLKIDESWKEYAEVKKNSKNLRTTFIHELAKAKAEQDKTDVAGKIRQLLNAEDMRRISKAVKYTLGKLYSSGLTRVLAPDINGDIHEDGERYREITDRGELEEVFLQSNQAKYHRCEPYCDLLKQPLLDDIGFCGEGPRVQDILEGTYVCPDDTTRGTKLFLREMSYHPNVEQLKSISARSSVEEFHRCWKRAREMSSSFGALHNAHYKVGCEHKRIRHMHYALAEVLYNSGYYLDRHRTGIDCMLLKSADDYRLKKIRTIFLFDSELNMNMGRVGEAGLASYIAGGDMADEQYSRPCRSAIDHVVNRRLSFNHYYFNKKPFGMCSCDLAGNYDRIVHSAASLALQRVGVPLSRIHGLFDTIQRMIKKVRTAFGDSVKTYGGDHIPYVYHCKPMGVYQGNRIGPPIWSVISSTIFAILRGEGFGFHFMDAISREVYHLVGFAYVDDSDLGMDGDSALAVAEDLQKALDLWGEVMNTTGQALAPEKSWWYLVDLVWKGGKWKFTDGGIRTDLVATDSDGKEVSLKRIMFSEAKKMLGVFLAPDGNKTAEIKYLKEKPNTWADMIRAGHLGPVETWIALSTGIWKSILYPLAATTLTDAEIRTITAPIMDVALPRMLVNRNMALPLRYGPQRLGGIGLPNPVLDQGIKKISYIVEHLWKQTPTGQILHRNVSSLCLEGGFFGSPFERDTIPLAWMTSKNSWIAHAWSFACSKNIKISNLPCHFLGPQRMGDVSLMTEMAKTIDSPALLTKLNACRLYLRVSCLSDICLAQGNRVDGAFLYDNSPLPEPKYRNPFLWPRQPRPPYMYWKLWNTHIRTTFCCSNTDLATPLGHFLHDIDPRAPHWDWFFHCDDNGLSTLWRFDKTLQRWERYAPHASGSTRRVRFYRMHGTWPETALPLTLVPVSVSSREDDGWIIVSRAVTPLQVKCSPVTSIPVQPQALDDHLQISGVSFKQILSTCAEGRWYIKHLIVPHDITPIFNDFLTGRLLTGSDGSFNPDVKYGTACWRLDSFDGRLRIFGYCIIPGRRAINSSFRCELGGILGNTICLWALSRLALQLGFNKDILWKILVSCDGYAALERSLLSSPDRLTTTYKHYDLVSAIMGYWRNMPCRQFPVYVKSHQDEVLPPSKLSRLEQLNISVDISAKLYMRRCVDANVPIPSGRFQYGLPAVTYANQDVNTELYSTLMRHCTEDDIKNYWFRNWDIPQHQRGSIDWDGFEKGMGMLRKTQQVFITKWLSRQISVGPISQRYDEGASSLCLRCRRESETLMHCVRCKSIRPKVQRRLDHLHEQILEYGTCPDLVDGIKLCTSNWLRDSKRSAYDFLDPLKCEDTVSTLCDLYEFGWWRFLQGIHLTCFRELQQAYFESTDSPKSLNFWHGKVIHALWQFLCDLHEDRRLFLVQRRTDLEPINPAVRAATRVAFSELSHGRASLPPFYHQMFHLSAAALKAKKVSALRDWLRTVRCARENDVSHSQTSDDFSPNGKYREWLMRR